MATSGSSAKSDSSAPANKLESIQKALHQFLHTPSAVTPVFELIEKNAKLKREYLFLGRSFFSEHGARASCAALVGFRVLARQLLFPSKPVPKWNSPYNL